MSCLLGIETSCDDTAAAVLRDGAVQSSIVSSQHDIHADYGGVVPELASRNHQRYIAPVVQQALAEAEVSLDALDAVAVTHGPGLPGSLLVGLSYAKALAAGRGLPLVGVNHLAGHLYSTDLAPEPPQRPYVALIVSGGHTMLVHVADTFTHRVLGQTRDDAAGEAFDKVAQLLDLGYPGGPAIDTHAAAGDPSFHDFPRTRLDAFDFSFSGLKTSVLYYLRDLGAERAAVLDAHLADVCASFQQAVVDVLVGALADAVAATGVSTITIAGGVAANSALRAAVHTLAAQRGLSVHLPPMDYCMDNAAMIAHVGALRWARGTAAPATLDIDPRLAL
ncbi:tRNA (adenosine(37)-N6)-threonylcarbamoyltransferase complex transferase subunit TsaD [Salisaeta longa]|uniref:tRNA (adenosine(37)-N6)-threonylcarbamoyltransferase complex transferase subunit TsaD n=1 Tax=Salisaeta longa TaxID=503170 RepID=UPI0003B75B41|nr:tRNA (adenosine(37)-N6)-threonylcarbamoyltransferase complex transferase subunit TsaD [Salisaeta longa]